MGVYVLWCSNPKQSTHIGTATVKRGREKGKRWRANNTKKEKGEKGE
eukprot:SAG11_NODE_16495_length_546_cov_0.420582_1_plen_46_part_10